MSLKSILGRFGRAEGGAVIAEAVLVLPFMLWSYLAMFVYWDAFRSQNEVQKGAYAISDMISREMLPLSTNYLAGLKTVMEFLIDSDQTVKLRVSSITWSEINNGFEVHWSRSPGNSLPELTTLTLQDFNACSNAADLSHCLLPAMADGDYVVVVETVVNYHPTFNIGMPDETLTQFIVTRPRFVPKVCMSGVLDC